MNFRKYFKKTIFFENISKKPVFFRKYFKKVVFGLEASNTKPIFALKSIRESEFWRGAENAITLFVAGWENRFCLFWTHEPLDECYVEGFAPSNKLTNQSLEPELVWELSFFAKRKINERGC